MPAPAATHQVLIASYAKDFPFLEHCLWSLKRFSDGFLPPVISVSSVDYEAARNLVQATFPQAQVRIRDGHPEHGFMRAQLSMLEGDKLCEGDYVWLVGSDCFAHRSMRPEDYFRNDRPVLLYNSYEYLEKIGSQGTCWRDGVTRILGVEPEHEYMRRLPIIYPRELFSGLRWYVETMTGECFDAVVYREWIQNRDVSESNLLGAFAWHFRHSVYDWVNLDGKEDWQREWPNALLQFWSHGGIEHKSDRHDEYLCGETFGKTFREVISDVRRAAELEDLQQEPVSGVVDVDEISTGN